MGGEIVGPDEMGNAIALQQVGMTGTRVVGPLVTSVLVAEIPFIGTGGAYLGDERHVYLRHLQPDPAPADEGSRRERQVHRGQFQAGVRPYRQPTRLALLVSSFIGVIMFGFSRSSCPASSKTNWAGPQRNWCVFRRGRFWARRDAGRRQQGRRPKRLEDDDDRRLHPRRGVGGHGAFSNFWQVMFWMFIGGAGSSAFQLLNDSLIMQNCDQAYYGRVMSLTMMAWGMNGVVGFPFGLLADATGERQTIFLMACLVLAVVTAVAAIHVSLNRRSAGQPVAAPSLATSD